MKPISAGHNWKRQRAGGFNLLEMMLAVNIFACMMTALCFLWARHAKFQRQTLTYALANQLAQSLLNQQISQGYTGTPPTDQVVAMKVISDGLRADIQYQCHVAVVDKNPGTVDLRELTVQIRWTEADVARNVTLKSLLYWNG